MFAVWEVAGNSPLDVELSKFYLLLPAHSSFEPYNALSFEVWVMEIL